MTETERKALVETARELLRYCADEPSMREKGWHSTAEIILVAPRLLDQIEADGKRIMKLEAMHDELVNIHVPAAIAQRDARIAELEAENERLNEITLNKGDV